MPEHNLDELIPEDIGISHRGVRYEIPGDLDVETTARLFGMFFEALKLEAKAGQVTAAQLNRAGQKMRSDLLELFRIRQPDMETLPFGVVGTSHVIRILLSELGIVSFEPANDDDGGGGEADATPTVPPRAKKKAARGTKARRSSSRSRR